MREPQKWRRILVEARTHIDASRETFTCVAVNRAGRELGDNKTVWHVEGFITHLLEGWFTLDCWVFAQSNISKGSPEMKKWESRGARLTRLAWIDWMLTQPEFSEDA